LVTGGAGYIGSHTVLELLNEGHEVVVVDNLCNSSIESLNRVKQITGKDIEFFELDICERPQLREFLQANRDIDAVIHFAALKAVGESTQIPLKYYQNNVHGTLTLLEELQDAEIYNFVFSSSATVYGDPASVPIKEDFPTSATNPYGQSKLMMEIILKDVAAANENWSISLLRYFNPIGAHESGLIGEDPNGIPNNLMPFISQVAVGKREQLSVFGDDYPTPDGTGVRDYIHVVDLAKGHLKALAKIQHEKGVITHNLGTGNGYSVLDMVNAFERVSGVKVPYQIVERRPGDIAECWADPSLAEQELGWKAEKSLDEMMADTWRWQSNNPNGFN
jgi:UDP-glucose 4-epimerase